MMTDAAKQLLEDNINVFYKYCVMYNIYDEDERQSYLERLCHALESFDPERGAVSTFMFKVLHNESIRRYNKSLKEIDTISLQSPAYKEGDEVLTLESITGKYDHNIEAIVAADYWKYLQDWYRKKFPKCCDRDLEIFTERVLGDSTEEVAKKHKLSIYKVNSIYRRTQSMLYMFARKDNVKQYDSNSSVYKEETDGRKFSNKV